MKKLWIALVLFIGCYPPNEPVLAENYDAIANLGISEYGDVARVSHPKGLGNVSFTSTFTDAYQEIDALLSTGKVPIQEYNLKWSDTHTFRRLDFPAIVQEARRFVPLIDKYPSVECIINPAVEHQLNRQDATDLCQQVLKVVPERCKCANNPWVGKGQFVIPTERMGNEVHGANPRPPNVGGWFICSLDGSDAFDVDVVKFLNTCKDAKIRAVWTSQNNGRKNRNDPTPRPQRKAWPTGRLLQALGFLFTSKGHTTKGNNNTLKPKSDQHTVPPGPRELKPVFITPTKVQNIKAVMLNGAVLATSATRQDFADGRSRYYFSEMYGYEYAKKALQLSGNPLVHLKANGRTLATVNLGFRE